MKLLIISILLSIQIAKAQDALQEPLFSIGPNLSLVAGVNGNAVPDGRKNGLSFSSMPDFGISIFRKFGSTDRLGMSLDINYSSYPFLMTDMNGATPYNVRFNYLTFSPRFYWLYFSIGFEYGIPMAATYGPKIDKTILKNCFTPVIAASYPLMNDEIGVLTVFVRAGYMLTGVYKNYTKDDNFKTIFPPSAWDSYTNDLNPTPVYASFGFSYMFHLY
ncbi:MAG: hypothetical protein NT007_04270 [Candidatus Kapabacteria bacterium]|nr:hypothetical protein [Candidatus Kapabacteria bacterium]